MLTPRIDDPNYANEKIRRAAHPETFGTGLSVAQKVSEDIKTEGIVDKAVQDEIAKASKAVDTAKKSLDSAGAELAAARNKGGVAKAVMTKLEASVADAEDALLDAEDVVEKLTA